MKIQEKFLEQSKKNNLTERIIRLDHLSGLVFFGTFLFVIIITGISIWMFLIVFPMSVAAEYQWVSIITFAILFLGILYWIDLLSSGFLRKNKVISKVYFPVYWFFNTISLGFLYRHFLQIISTNINKWKAVGFVLFMFISSLLFSYASLLGVLHLTNIFDKRSYPATLSGNLVYEGMYLDRIPDEARVGWACIQSDLVTDDFLRVFIPFKANYVYGIAEAQKRDFSEIVTVSINDSLCRNVEWFRYMRKVSGQSGIIAYLPIGDLKKGKSDLIIEIDDAYFKRKKPGVREGKLIIPFWKQ